MAALVYHSLNGLRVIVMDFWPATTRWYRPLTYGVIIGTVVAMIPLGLIMITPYAPWNGRDGIGRKIWPVRRSAARNPSGSRARPDEPGCERCMWYFMRLSGLLLVTWRWATC